MLVARVALADDKGSREEPPSSFPVLSGIGAALSITETGPQIGMVLPGSAAEKSGKLKQGDRILSIRNGDRTIDLKGKPLGDVVSLIRGPVGTAVTLEVLSANSQNPILVTVKREAVAVPALTKNRTYDELIGTPAPTIEFSSLDQSSHIDLSRYQGKIVVVDFWASWCEQYVTERSTTAAFSLLGVNWQFLCKVTVGIDCSLKQLVLVFRSWDPSEHPVFPDCVLLLRIGYRA